MLADHAGIIDVIDRVHFDVRIVVYELVELASAHQEGSDKLPTVDRLFLIRDDTGFGQGYHPIGEHLGVNTEIPLVPQRKERCVRDGADAHLERGSIGNEGSNVFADPALDIAEVLIRSSAIDVVVVDSVAALVPAAEIEGEMGDSHVGLQARLMSQALRKLAGAVAKSKTCLIFTNQIRMKIGVLYGNPETTTGGNALKFYATVRLDIRRTGQITDGDTVIGNQTRVKVVKNKVAPPFRQAEFEILFGEGISFEGDLIELGVSSNIISKMGSWYSFGEERIGQGKDNARMFLKENKDIRRKIEESVRAHYGLPMPSAGTKPQSGA